MFSEVVVGCADRHKVLLLTDGLREMVFLFEELAVELQEMILGYSELDEVVSLARVSRRFAGFVKSWLSCFRAWKGRIVRHGVLNVSNVVGGYFHYNEGGLKIQMRLDELTFSVDVLFECGLVLALPWRYLRDKRVWSESCLFIAFYRRGLKSDVLGTFQDRRDRELLRRNLWRNPLRTRRLRKSATGKWVRH